MRSRVRSFSALFGVVALGALGMVAFAPSAVAAAVPASIPDGDPGSLRDVLDNAANGATVELEAGATYQLTDCEAGDNGALSTSQDLIIVGNGATLEQTCDSYVWESEGNLSIDGLTITGGLRHRRPPGRRDPHGRRGAHDHQLVDREQPDLRRRRRHLHARPMVWCTSRTRRSPGTARPEAVAPSPPTPTAAPTSRS